LRHGPVGDLKNLFLRLRDAEIVLDNLVYFVDDLFGEPIVDPRRLVTCFFGLTARAFKQARACTGSLSVDAETDVILLVLLIIYELG
jgi:hypothetical protein